MKAKRSQYWQGRWRLGAGRRQIPGTTLESRGLCKSQRRSERPHIKRITVLCILFDLDYDVCTTVHLINSSVMLDMWKLELIDRTV